MSTRHGCTFIKLTVHRRSIITRDQALFQGDKFFRRISCLLSFILLIVGMFNFIGMDSVKDIKDWLINKCKIGSVSNTDASTNQVGDSSNYCGALTPKSIPEFVIPGSGDSSRRTSSELESIDEDFPFRSFSPRNSIASSNKTSPGTSPIGSSSCLDVPRRTSSFSRSAPVSPKHELKLITNCHNSTHSLGYNEHEDGTNADPLSLAAVSLPHFRAQTSFGFTTLSQSPHTRRKESLFHTGSDSLLPRRVNSFDGLKIGSFTDGPHEILLESEDLSPTNKCKCRRPSVVLTPSNGTKIGSPVKKHSFDDPSTNLMSNSRSYVKFEHALKANGGIAYFKSKGKYYRRRSSLLEMSANNSSDESLHGDSTDSSTDQKRRSMSSLYPTKESSTLKRHSAPHLTPGKSSEAHDLSEKTQHTFMPYNETPCQFLVQHGELKFAFQYLAKSKQLKVSLIRAENLGGQGKTDQNLNPFAKLYLMPGKLQRQMSEIIKHTRHPLFEQEFYFQGLTLEQLHAMTLRIKVFHKSGNLKLPEFIGKVDVGLDSYDLLTENRMWKDLDNKRDKEELGSLEVSLKFQPQDESFQVTVEQAKGLPHHPITGQPNPYVRVECHQQSKSVSRKNTKTKKNISDPIYHECFTFNVSPKKDDIKSTKLSLTVFDHDRIRTDNIIGQVVICPGALHPTAEEHWIDAITCPGEIVTMWHDLYDHDDDFK